MRAVKSYQFPTLYHYFKSIGHIWVCITSLDKENTERRRRDEQAVSCEAFACMCARPPSCTAHYFQQHITSCFRLNIITQTPHWSSGPWVQRGWWQNTTNVILCPVTWSMFLFSFQRRARPARSVACASFRNQAGIIRKIFLLLSLSSGQHVHRHQQMSNYSTISPLGLIAPLHCVLLLSESIEEHALISRRWQVIHQAEPALCPLTAQDRKSTNPCSLMAGCLVKKKQENGIVLLKIKLTIKTFELISIKPNKIKIQN